MVCKEIMDFPAITVIADIPAIHITKRTSPAEDGAARLTETAKSLIHGELGEEFRPAADKTRHISFPYFLKS